MKFKLTSSQMNFFSNNFALDSLMWYQGIAEVFPKIYPYEQINDVCNKFIGIHDCLRGHLEDADNDVVINIRENEYKKYEFWQVSDDDLQTEIVKFLNRERNPYEQLADCAIFQTPTRSGVMIVAHHLIVDGLSTFIMSEQINEMLKNEDYVPIIQSYGEHAEKEENHKLTKRFIKDKEYWLKQFSNEPNCSIFALHGNAFDYGSSEVNSPIPAKLFAKIKSFCDYNEITLGTFFNTVIAAYINQRFDVNNFTIGVPVLNRSTQAELNTIGLYMHVVPLVVNVFDESFVDNAKRIEDQKMTLFRHQKFTQHDIKNLLKENEIAINQLFDVVADVQEFPSNDEYEMRIPYNHYLSLPIEMHFQSFSEEKHNLKIRYRTAFFNEQEVQVMLNSLFVIIENVLETPNKNIYELEMTSSEEKQKVVYEFNVTSVDYENDKCIHELFEEQVERTPNKVALVATDKTVTYRELNEEANRIAHSLAEKGIGKGDIVGLMLPRKSYLLSALLGILKTGAAYLPIDMELPKERIEYMCKDTNAVLVVLSDNIDELLQSKDTSNLNVEMSNESLCYCIYTSGSTGQPKGVMARHRNVVNYISKNEHNIFGKIIKEDFEAIVSISTCSFDIFVTETIATLVNGLRVVLADEQQCRNQYELNKLLSREKGEFLQTTPTKLKVLTAEPSQRAFLKNVKAILLGGEAMETSYLNELKKITNAKIYNIYGVTEVPIWSTFADTDTFVDEVTVGKPIANTQVYILDKYLKPTPIGVMGELCIAGESVSMGYLNSPERTAEKFIDNPFGKGKLYKTGDLAYWRADGNIVYIGRNDFQVKIRGLRIELGEIESAIQAIQGIERAVVVVRKDREERQLICAFYTGEEFDAKELRKELSVKLPKYMVPHIFTHLEKMPMTASGKANRNALPEIDLENISTEVEYAAPQTKEEILLTESIAKVLGVENIGILNNFFDIGGDSLKSIELVGKLEDKGYTVNIKDIFEALNIQELAAKLTAKEETETTVTYSSVIPATAAQMRVYTAQKVKSDAVHYNITYAFNTMDIDRERLEKAVNMLIDRHDSLRTRFESIDGVIHQVIEEKASVTVDILSDNEINSFAKPFDLTKAPLIRVGCSSNTVVVDIHHIIVDGESMPVFFRELNDLYMGRELPKVVQYGEFAVTDTYTEDNEKYWLDAFDEEVTNLELPTDYQRPEVQSFNGSQIYELIDIDVHNRVVEKCKELNITPYAYYMACYNILLSKYSGSEDICVGMPISGRSSKFLNTIGMFVNTIALRNNVNGNKTVKTLMQEIRDNSISAIDNQNYPFNELVKKLNINSMGRNPIFDVMFAYQSFEMTDISFGDEKAELIPMTTASSKCDMTFNILPRKDDVVLVADYCTDLYKEKTINKFIESFKSILNIALNENILIKDIEVSEQDNLLIREFNNTGHTYNIPTGSTLYSLFEGSAKENGNKVCVVAEGKEIRYKEMLTLSANTDKKIREYTDNEKSIIGVIADRSIEMYVAIYSIIRGGNAYLPISPEYPQERIDYILSDSKATLVLAQGKYTQLVKNTAVIDMTEAIKDTEEKETVPSDVKEDDTAYVIYTSGSTGKPKGAKVSHKSAVNRILWMEEAYPLEEKGVILQKTPYTFDVSVWEMFWWGIKGKKLAATKPNEHFLPAKIVEECDKQKVTHLHFVPSVFDLFLTYLENNGKEKEKLETVKHIFLSGEALSSSLVQRFYKLIDYRKTKLHNLYGPTECAVDVTYYDCTPEDTEIIPIGKPIYNTQIHIVDKYLNQLPIGVTGELCIAGVNVGQGYLNNEALTKEKFIDNPFGEGKLYKTGDLAYWREDGQVVFCGRMDGQIKLHGQRIEIGEIEAVISSIAGIEGSAVIVKKQGGQELLVAFYCGKAFQAKEIKLICEKSLPKYMVPSAFVHLDTLPLNASGKLDRKALNSIEIRDVIEDTIEEPQTETERMICEYFKSMLKAQKVGRNSDFFDLGGTSISMISLLSEEYFKEISPADFIANSTPMGIAKLMEEQNGDSFEYIKPLKQVANSKKALVCFPYGGGGAEAYAVFSKDFVVKSKEYSLFFVPFLRSHSACESAAQEILDLSKKYELYFYSHCAGAVVAMDILNILEAGGRYVINHYIFAGIIPPENPPKDNYWNTVSDDFLLNGLKKAGGHYEGLSSEQIVKMLDDFRKDTDFMTEYYYTCDRKIKAPISLVISKTDIFTENYNDAERLWSKYSENLKGVHFIETDSHYFQKDNSKELIDIVLGIIE